MSSQSITETPTQSSAPPRQSPQILILADDLTGACDSAAPFVRSGHTARVCLVPNPEAPETVQVRHTASRDLSPTAAAQAVTQVAAALPPTTPLIFKKVDSAGRGNIAAELLAAQKAFAADIILLAPSFPAAGRIVCCGILQITDITGQSTSISLAALFPEQYHQRIGKVGTPAQLPALIAAGKNILLCDATTDADLQAITQAAAELPARILWAGSAGLANALAEQHSANQPQQHPRLTQTGGTLVVAGTTHNVTQLQLQHLLSLPDITTITLDTDSPNGGAHNVLQIARDADDTTRIRNLWHRLSPKPAALILTGGDTAALVLQALHAKAILLRGELSPGIPWGTVQSGLAHNCTVITKSGGFGTETSLSDAIAFITERPS